MKEKLKNLLENILSEKFESIAQVENFNELEFWDSLVYVNLVIALQQEFKLELSKDDIQQLLSVSGIESILARSGVSL